jgi:hypothetical protein
LPSVCFWNTWYNPTGTKENIIGYTILKTHVNSIDDNCEKMGANITMLSIELTFEYIVESHNELLITLLAI